MTQKTQRRRRAPLRRELDSCASSSRLQGLEEVKGQRPRPQPPVMLSEVSREVEGIGVTISSTVTRLLGIAGSPRREGNTDLLLREALRLLAERTGATTEFVRVADRNLKPCLGCRECMKLGHCVIQDDDFEELWAQVLAADLIVLAAPVYWMGPPGVMKNFIDRTHGYYLNHNHVLLSGKRALLISVATDSGFESNEIVLDSWLLHYGAQILGTARVLSCEKGEVLQRPKEFAKVRQLVDSLAL